MKSIDIEVYADKEKLGYESARIFAELATKYIIHYDAFFVALSGGSTPQRMYQNLVRHFKNSLEWEKIHFFWSDERYVPVDHPDSNAGMAYTYLFNELNTLPPHIHPVDTHFDSPRDAADAYQALINQEQPPLLQPIPRFDLVLLGMGDDGHTASLFPDTDALYENEQLVAANWVPKFDKWRITFTLPLINSAKNIIFLLSGARKADIIKQIYDDDADYPAGRVSPVEGRLLWLLDQDAGQSLKIKS